MNALPTRPVAPGSLLLLALWGAAVVGRLAPAPGRAGLQVPGARAAAAGAARRGLAAARLDPRPQRPGARGLGRVLLRLRDSRRGASGRPSSRRALAGPARDDAGRSSPSACRATSASSGSSARSIRRSPSACGSSSFPGSTSSPRRSRFYPKGPLAAPLLGYVGTDDRGPGRPRVLLRRGRSGASPARSSP